MYLQRSACPETAFIYALPRFVHELSHECHSLSETGSVEMAGVAPVDVLYLLKRAHLYWPDNWDKHFADFTELLSNVSSPPYVSL